jgi:hypothetical protein
MMGPVDLPTAAMRSTRSSFVLVASLALPAAGCLGPAARPEPGDPTVTVATEGGSELGVSTDYGVLFLGRGAQSGEANLTAWFSDGPSWEAGSIEDVGGGLYTAHSQIKLTCVPLTFELPPGSNEVTVRGRRGSEVWEETTEVVRHPSVEGLLLRPTDRLRDMRDDEVGAGVFVGPPEARRLIGLVSGQLLLENGGESREFVTVLGPDDLWRVVLWHKSAPKPERTFYREDLL